MRKILLASVPSPKKGRDAMTYNNTVCNCTAVDPEELKAFQEAINDPDRRKEIISILEEAGLLHELRRQPA